MSYTPEQPKVPLITKTSVFDKSPVVWQEIKEQVILLTMEGLEIKANDPLLGQRDGVISFNNIEDAFLDPDSVVMILRDQRNNFIGYTLAMPIDRMDPDRAAEKKETAYMYYTVIAESYRGQGLASKLTDPLLVELNRQGYLYAERDTKMGNGYADNVEKNSQGSIVASYDADKFGLGQQRFFRIDIKKYLMSKGLLV